MTEIRSIKTREVINEIIKRYDFDKEFVDRELLGKQIQKICLKEPVTQNGVTTNLWECSGVIKNKEHLFTKAEVEKIVTHYDLCNYLLTCSYRDEKEKNKENTDKKLQAVIDMHDRVNNRIKSETEALYELHGLSNDIETYYSIEEVKHKKLEIMIEALYSRYFEPIDEELLHGDMETKANMSGTNYSDVQFEESLMRLDNPIEAYCVPKKK